MKTLKRYEHAKPRITTHFGDAYSGQFRLVEAAYGLNGEVSIQKWDRFAEEWQLWDCPYYTFVSRKAALAHWQDVFEIKPLPR